jgi:hypothetical protein
MRSHEPASLDRTISADAPGLVGHGCPATPELMAPRSPSNTAHLTRLHSERRVGQLPPPMTEDRRRSLTLAVSEREPLGNVAWFVRIPLVHA